MNTCTIFCLSAAGGALTFGAYWLAGPLMIAAAISLSLHTQEG